MNTMILIEISILTTLLFISSILFSLIKKQLEEWAILNIIFFIVYYSDYIKTIKKYIKNKNIKIVDNEKIKQEFSQNKENLFKKISEFYNAIKEEIISTEKII